MEPKHNLFIFVGILFLILIGYIGYGLYTNSTTVPAEKDLVQADLPDGVEIVERDGARFLRDEGRGFEIETMSLDVNDRGRFLSFSEDHSSIVPSGFSVAALENDDELSLESWLEKYDEEVGLLFFETREKFELGNVSGYKIKSEGDPDHYVYYINGGDKVYLFSTPYPEDYEGVVSTFKLLNTDYASPNQLSD